MMMAKVLHHGTFPEDPLYFFNKWSMIHITQEDARISEYTKTPGRPVVEDLYKDYLLKPHF